MPRPFPPSAIRRQLPTSFRCIEEWVCSCPGQCFTKAHPQEPRRPRCSVRNRSCCPLGFLGHRDARRSVCPDHIARPDQFGECHRCNREWSLHLYPHSKHPHPPRRQQPEHRWDNRRGCRGSAGMVLAFTLFRDLHKVSGIVANWPPCQDSSCVGIPRPWCTDDRGCAGAKGPTFQS